MNNMNNMNNMNKIILNKLNNIIYKVKNVFVTKKNAKNIKNTNIKKQKKPIKNKSVKKKSEKKKPIKKKSVKKMQKKPIKKKSVKKMQKKPVKKIQKMEKMEKRPRTKKNYVAKIIKTKSFKTPAKIIKTKSFKIPAKIIKTKSFKTPAKIIKTKSFKTPAKIIKTKSNILAKPFTRNASFIPSINNRLQIRSLRTLPRLSINLCENLLEININTSSGETCLPYTNMKVKALLLHNLKASKHLDITKFIAPVQFLSNCWFNTMFVTFFFSDKGRTFFRFFRELMITGRKIDGTPIPQQFAKIFFILNLFIEASYNQSSHSNVLFDKINSLTDKLNTNYFVYHIHKIINNPSRSISPSLLISNSNQIYNIPNIEDPGNPLTYYESILKYLKYNTLKLLKHSLTKQVNIDDVIHSKFLAKSITIIPDIIILEDFQSGTKFDTSIKLTDTRNNSYLYILDAIVITNKDHFDPEANSHFVSVLTVNKLEYKFDGSSLSKLSRFNWKKMINENNDWTFKEDPEYEPEKYNFTKGYKIMFYYRS